MVHANKFIESSSEDNRYSHRKKGVYKRRGSIYLLPLFNDTISNSCHPIMLTIPLPIVIIYPRSTFFRLSSSFCIYSIGRLIGPSSLPFFLFVNDISIVFCRLPFLFCLALSSSTRLAVRSAIRQSRFHCCRCEAIYFFFCAPSCIIKSCKLLEFIFRFFTQYISLLYHTASLRFDVSPFIFTAFSFINCNLEK